MEKKPMVEDGEKSCESKRSIFKEATRLFAIKGFNGTSVRDISSAAGVNVALINYHFKTKQNLFNEVVFYGFEQMEIRKASLRGKPLDEMLDIIYRGDVDTESGTGYYLIVVLNIFSSPEQLNVELASAIAENQKSEWMEVVVEAIKKHLPDSVPEVEVTKVAFMVNAFLVWMAQMSFGIMGHTVGFMGDFYEGADETEIRVNIIRDHAHRLINDLNSRYAV